MTNIRINPELRVDVYHQIQSQIEFLQAIIREKDHCVEIYTESPVMTAELIWDDSIPVLWDVQFLDVNENVLDIGKTITEKIPELIRIDWIEDGTEEITTPYEDNTLLSISLGGAVTRIFSNIVAYIYATYESEPIPDRYLFRLAEAGEIEIGIKNNIETVYRPWSPSRSPESLEQTPNDSEPEC